MYMQRKATGEENRRQKRRMKMECLKEESVGSQGRRRNTLESIPRRI